MTTTRPSELVARELKKGEYLAQSLRTHSSIVSPILDQEYLLVTGEGDTSPDAAWEQERKARLLDRATDELTGLFQDRRDADSDRTEAYASRDMWFTVLRGELFSVQTTLRARCGRAVVKAVGLAGPLAGTAEKLALQARHAEKRLVNKTLQPKTGTLSVEGQVEAARLYPAVDELELANELSYEADRRVAEALRRQTEAYERLHRLNSTIGQQTYAEYRRAGFEDLASRLRHKLHVLGLPSSSGGTSDPDPAPAPPPDGTPPDGTPPSDPPQTTTSDDASAPPDVSTA